MGIFSENPIWNAIILMHGVAVAWVVGYFAVVGVIHTFGGN